MNAGSENQQMEADGEQSISSLSPGTAQGDGNQPLDDPVDPTLEDPPTEQWTDPETGIEYTIASDSVMIGLVYEPEYPDPEPPVEEEITQAVPLPYTEDLSTHPVFQALIGEGYSIISQWPEVAAALMRLPEGTTVEEAMAELPLEYEDIEYVDPDVFTTLDQNQNLPTDTFFPWQWYFYNQWWPSYGDWDVDAPEGWYYETGSEWTHVIAVIGTGVARNNSENTVVDHPDLSPRLTYYGGHTGRSSRDIRAHGGYPKPSESGPYWTHETSVSGIIAAVTNNQLPIGSMAGANWNSQTQIFPVQIRMAAGWKFWSSAVNNAYYLVGQATGIFRGAPVRYRIRVLNASLGNHKFDRTEARLLSWLGIYMVLVASAGNYGVSTPYYPAALGRVLGVGATRMDGYMADWSNYGWWLNVTAPGEYLFTTTMSTYEVPGYTYFFGTSGSAPIVSGLASLVISEMPSFRAHQVYYWIIWNRAKARNGPGHHYDPGKVNYYYALMNLQ